MQGPALAGAILAEPHKKDIFATMNARLITLLLISTILMAGHAAAQDSSQGALRSVQDSTQGAVRNSQSAVRSTQARPDSVRKDSVVIPVIKDTVSVSKRSYRADELFPALAKYPTIYGPFVGGYMKANERFNVTGPVRRVPVLVREREDRDWVFYFFCGLLLIVAFVNLAFGKYFIDLFRVFFNTSLRQKQLREQLSQTPLPSLLLNLVFCLSGGAFIFFILRQYNITTGFHPAVELLLAVGAIAAIYLVKYIFVSMLGWMFDRRNAAESYLFTVFLVNKVAGLALIPVTLVMAYTAAGEGLAVLTVGLMILAILLLMRLTKGFLAISALRINVVQFLVFVGAFEVVPALLIYKVLLRVIV